MIIDADSCASLPVDAASLASLIIDVDYRASLSADAASCASLILTMRTLAPR
jgi:hypothetical protein